MPICSGIYSHVLYYRYVLLPVDGQWGVFGSWSSCSVTCGGGVRTRERACDSPPPSGGGADCVGISTSQEECNTDVCPGEELVHSISWYLNI